MRMLRVLAALVWAAASLVGANASACEHEGAVASMHEDAAMVMPATDGPGHAMHEGTSEGEDCAADCCEGACACEGVTVADLPLPGRDQAPSMVTALAERPLDTNGVGVLPGAEGPPPRLL